MHFIKSLKYDWQGLLVALNQRNIVSVRMIWAGLGIWHHKGTWMSLPFFIALDCFSKLETFFWPWRMLSTVCRGNCASLNKLRTKSPWGSGPYLFRLHEIPASYLTAQKWLEKRTQPGQYTVCSLLGAWTEEASKLLELLSLGSSAVVNGYSVKTRV